MVLCSCCNQLAPQPGVGQLKFIHHDLGQRTAGEIVEVSLTGSAANVRLMDSSDLSAYRAGRRHQYLGGLARRSPVRLQIPHAAHWHVTIDMAGLRGQTRASVRILPSAPPPLREIALASVPSLVRSMPDNGQAIDACGTRTWDVFISYASEDKELVVRPLAHALQGRELAVWFDEFELRIGDSLRRRIDHGLARSRFGVVVLSHHFFTKGWPSYELDGLVTKGIDGDQAILPIWHNISKSEVVAFSPSLADKLARSTATHTVDEIADEVASVIRPS